MNFAKLKARRKEILTEISNLAPMRRGSCVEQFVETVLKDGTRVRRGPYALYSFKDKGKTVSRRITKPRQVAVYRNQIQSFRRFQQLIGELIIVSEQLSDLALVGADDKKKPKSKSISKKKSR